jgi:hypothetical protein
VEDMCYERRRAEACVDESAHHALVNAGVGRLCERRRGSTPTKQAGQDSDG